MKKVQRPFCPPPAKNTIIVFFAIAFFNMLDPLVHAQTLTLTPSNYNGNNISCFGAQDGSINLTISGVTPPYTIRWSNDATTEDLSNLPAGYYNVEVDDTIPSTEALQAEITLTEPEALGVELTVSDYLVNARHYTISLNGACNGSITPSVGGGTAPYTYNWEPYGQTTANLTNICAGGYNLNVTDANGCAAPAQQDMTEPDRDDWQMTGNTGTNPATQFIGTLDSVDLSLKTYSQERLRIKANGDLKINSLGGNAGMVYIDDDGILRSSSSNLLGPCGNPVAPVWQTVAANGGNPPWIWTCPQINVAIGFQTLPPNNVNFSVFGRSYLSGPTGIGISAPSEKLHVVGNAIFTQSTSTPSNAPLIRGTNSNSSASAPDYTWSSDQGTGMFHDAAGVIAFSKSGSETMRIHSNGNVGIGGIAVPQDKLDINGRLRVRDSDIRLGTNDGRPQNVTGQTATDGVALVHSSNHDVLILNYGNSFEEGVQIDGNVGIGIDPATVQLQTGVSSYKLIVNGKLGVRDDIYVQHTGAWPDYVFQENYMLPELSDVANYFKKHKHFEGFLSANEIESCGQPVGVIQNKQQEKLEQAYLYLIKHDQRLEVLERQNVLLKKQNELLEQRLKMLEK